MTFVAPAPLVAPALALSGLDALLASLATPAERLGHDAVAPGSDAAAAVPVLVATGEVDPADVDDLLARVERGRRGLLAVSVSGALDLAAHPVLGPVMTDAPHVLASPDPADPLVLDPHVVAAGGDDLAGSAIEADDFVALRVPPDDRAAAVALVGGEPVGVRVHHGRGVLVVIGSVAALTDRWIAAADNAAVVAWAVTGHRVEDAGHVVRAHLPSGAVPVPIDHAPVAEVDNDGDDRLLSMLPARDLPFASPEFLRAAAHAGRLLSAPVHDALVDLVDEGAPAGALLLRGLPVGDVPPTPASPTEPTGKDSVSELVLLTVARRLGQPVGYEPEHGGDIVQNLLPTAADADRQTSTSSAVDLEFHTETAFHRHKPRYLLLLCLRGDPAALTLLCSISQVVERLPLGVRQVLREPRFRTGVDESFTGVRSPRLGHLVPVLSGTDESPTFTFDADLMVGVDAQAADALTTLRDAIRAEHVGVALESGDLLVVDNSVTVHGRSSFTARFDGTDRWLQRTFVVPDLAASATERRGRVITTRFA